MFETLINYEHLKTFAPLILKKKEEHVADVLHSTVFIKYFAK